MYRQNSLQLNRQISQESSSFESLTLPEIKPHRKTMKPQLPRKLTASTRINLNRFWNELEDLQNRKRSKNS